MKDAVLEGNTLTFIDNLRTAVIILDLEGRITHFNRTAEVYSGFRGGEVLGRCVWDFLIGRDDAGILKQAFEDLKATGLQTEMDTVWRTREGGTRTLHWSNAPVRDGSGMIRWIVDTFIDLTEEREVARRLIRSRAELELERQSAIFLAESAYRLYSAPADRSRRLELVACLPVPYLADWAVARLLARDSDEFEVATSHRDPSLLEAARSLQAWPQLRKGPLDFVGKRENPLSAQGTVQWGLLQSLGWAWHACIEISGLDRRNRGLLVLGSRAPVPAPRVGANGEETVRLDRARVARDFVQRVTPALDAASHSEDSTRAVRVRDQFLSIASHELRTPLTTLQLQTDLLRRNRDAPGFLSTDLGTRALTIVQQQVERMARIVLEMLDSTALENSKIRLRPEPFDLRELIYSVAASLELYRSATGCQLTVEPGPPVTGCWDRHRVGQILMNLLTNAFKYARRSVVTVRCRQEPGRAVFEVADNGPGIALADQERIFDRFEQGSGGEAGGLGLGLFIARGMARAHGGTLILRSEPGQGATFACELPSQEGCGRAGGPPQPDPGESPGSR